MLSPTTPDGERAYAFTTIRFGLFPFRSPLLGESNFLSFPRGTEMVHFPRFASAKNGGYPSLRMDGLPHSGIPGSQVACTSPGLIAACHALHRQDSPRHPPQALSSLAINSNFQRTINSFTILYYTLILSTVKIFCKLIIPQKIISCQD